ncbi:MAG TPA: hypothetical protein VEL75_02060 [Candidatus Methylomirabilis sp.]|nr:hypothetical protein [Candidatus Methylomirabilis sp.]
MGVRKSTGKQKKSKRSAATTAAQRRDTVRRVARDQDKPRPQGMR